MQKKKSGQVFFFFFNFHCCAADGHQDAQTGRAVRPVPGGGAGGRYSHRQAHGLSLQRHSGRGVGVEEGQVPEPGHTTGGYGTHHPLCQKSDELESRNSDSLSCFYVHAEKVQEVKKNFLQESGIQFTDLEEKVLQFHLSNLEYACGSTLNQVIHFSHQEMYF